ncbi:MAG: YraN family protein [Candidatus Gracilibacteria bacterium]|nr:YraN family protein [Candidatus Gracilibacteria bacterium]MDD4530540.1 YraN family protein [Candidatus Gracilibacteria bacterium]
MQNKKQTGNEGELIAINFLVKNGYKILETNHTIKGGEIDIICEKDEKIIFVEVKFRKNENYGTGEEAFTKAKRKTLLRTIQKYCLSKKIDLDNIQMDFVAISKQKETYNLKHYENVEI